MFKTLARASLAAAGWTVRNDLPEGLDKFVIIAAPHTSNWDFPVTMAIAATVDMNFYWVGKHTLFRRPFGGLMRRLGGIPVDRRRSMNFVEQIAEAFDEADRMALGIAPEGTRSKSAYWKSGFYHIAREAGVPIVCGFIDFDKKEGGLGPVIDSNQPKEAVLEELRAFYDGIQGRRPEQFTPPRFRDHAADAARRAEGFDVQGHRGARGLKPENTLPSFEAALDLEVDTLELDLHLAADDRIVVWHDPYVYASKCDASAAASAQQPRPTTKRAAEERAMVRRMDSDQLGRLRCDQNPAPELFPDQNAAPTTLAGSDYGIVTLERVFDLVERYAASPEKSPSQRASAAKVRFNLEIKRHPAEPELIGDGFDGSEPATLERALVDLVRARGLVERVNVQSFVSASLWAVARLEPALDLAVLEGSRKQPLADYADKGASTWSPNASLVDAASIREAREAGLLVKPWTVNDPAEMRRLIDLGVDGIITDRPDLLIELLGR